MVPYLHNGRFRLRHSKKGRLVYTEFVYTAETIKQEAQKLQDETLPEKEEE